MLLSALAALLQIPHEGADLNIEAACAIDATEKAPGENAYKIAPLFDYKWHRAASSSTAGAFLVTPRMRDLLPPQKPCLIATETQARNVWGSLLRALYPDPPLHRPESQPQLAQIDATAELQENVVVGPFVYVGPQAQIGAQVTLHPGVYVGARAKIGARSVLFPGAVIWDDVQIGEDCQIGAHAVIGGPGFGLDAQGNIPHAGRVVIEDRVRIGACSCIDRATLESTFIGKNAQIDNLVQVGHNVHLGAGSVVCGQAGIAGSAKIGEGVLLGGQSGVSNGVELEDGVKLAAQSCATRRLRQNGVYSGSPAEPHRARLRWIARLKKL